MSLCLPLILRDCTYLFTTTADDDILKRAKTSVITNHSQSQQVHNVLLFPMQRLTVNYLVHSRVVDLSNIGPPAKNNDMNHLFICAKQLSATTMKHDCDGNLMCRDRKTMKFMEGMMYRVFRVKK